MTTLVIPITNNQTSDTPANLQVKVQFNALTYKTQLAADLGNIRLYSDDDLTSPLYGWVESGASNTATNTVFWVLIPSVIPAGSTLLIYMTFLSTSTEYDGNYWGQAPQLSGTYGQYDNGANVFPFYDNFAGTALNSRWTVSGITYTVNNGFTATVTAAEGYIISKALALNPATHVLDFYGTNFQTASTYWTAVGMLDGGENGGTSGSGLGSMIVAGYPSASQTNGWQRNSTSGLQTSGAMQTAQAAAIWTVEPTAPSSTNFYINYGGLQTVSAYADTYPLYEGLVSAGAADTPYTFSVPVAVTWFRVRLYPPNGVLPSTSVVSIATPRPPMIINRYHVIETISNPVYTTGGMTYSSTELSVITDAHVIELVLPSGTDLRIAQVTLTHSMPGGETLAPNQIVIAFFDIENGVLVEAEALTYYGVQISIIMNGW